MLCAAIAYRHLNNAVVHVEGEDAMAFGIGPFVVEHLSVVGPIEIQG